MTKLVALTSLLLVSAMLMQPTLAQSGRNPPCAGEADVVFLVDASDSTTAVDFAQSLNFLRGDNGFLRTMELRTSEFFHSQVGLVLNRGTTGNVDIRLGNFTDLAQLANAILQIGSTRFLQATGNLTAAMRLAGDQFKLVNGGRNGLPHVLFMIITDVLISRSNANALRTVANQLFSEGIIVMAAVYGYSQDPNAINSVVSSIVSYPPDQYKYYFDDARMTSSQQYGNDQRNRSFTQLCTEIPSCASFADVAFLLDSSGNVWPGDWIAMINFVTSVVQHLYISATGARIALAKFGRDQELIFNLNSYTNRYQVLQAIQSVQFQQKPQIDISSAINFASQRIFSDAGGWRAVATHILIVITTGFSNVNAGQTAQAAKLLQDRNVFMFAIGVGPEDARLTAELQQIASKPPKDFYFSVSSFQILQLIDTTLVNRACRPLPAQCNATIDLVFLIDTSGSVADNAFRNILGFVSAMVSRLKIDEGLARVGVVTYGDNANPQIFLGNYTTSQALQFAITQIPYSGGRTNTAGALAYVRNVVFRPETGSRDSAIKLLLIITDGQSDNITTAVDQARFTRTAGIGIIGLGVGPDANMNDLRLLASYPSDDNTFNVADYEILSTFVDPLIKLMCGGSSNCNSNPCKNGGTCYERFNGYYCECPDIFSGPTCDQKCSHYMSDVIFVLDSSGSISRQQYDDAQKFIRDVVLRLKINLGSRVGAIIFGTDFVIKIQLKDYTTTEDTLDAISFEYIGGATDMAQALRVVCQNMFVPEQGDRPGILNVLVLITDGKSTSLPPDSTLRTALDCRAKGIHISAVGIGDDVDVTELSNIVTEPASANFIKVEDFTALGIYADRLTDSLCNKDDNCLNSTCHNDTSTCVDGINRFTCICSSGYIGQSCDISCLNQADVAFVIDYAASKRWEVKLNITNFILDSVNQLSVDTDVMRVAIMYYTDRPYILLNLNASTMVTDIKFAALTGTAPINGSSNLTAAFASLQSDIFNLHGGDRSAATNIAVIVIDSVPAQGLDQVVSAAINAHIAGIYTILVTVGEGMNTGRQYISLQAIASDPADTNFLNVWNYTSLPRIAPDVASRMCNGENECLSNPCSGGSTCVDGINGYKCQCDGSRSGVNCERTCTVRLDVIFIADISGSLELGGYNIHVDFMDRIIDGLNFQGDRTHVSFVTFAGTTMVQFYLDKYVGVNAQLDIKNALKITNVYEGTDIATALRTVKSNVLTRGRRSDVTAACILLSDGKATMNAQDTVSAAIDLQTDCKVYAIGVQPDPQTDVLEQIASDPSQFYTFYVPYRSNATDAANGVLDSLCRLS